MSNPVMPGEKTRHFKFETTPTSVVIVSVASGEKRTYSTDISAFTSEMVQRLVTHAVKQKLSDDAASTADTAGKIVAQNESYARLIAGTWTERKASSTEDGLSASHSYFATAAAAISKKPVEEITGALLAMDPDTRKSYVAGKSKHPKIAAHLAMQAADRAKAKAKELSKGTASASAGDDFEL